MKIKEAIQTGLTWGFETARRILQVIAPWTKEPEPPAELKVQKIVLDGPLVPSSGNLMRFNCFWFAARDIFGYTNGQTVNFALAPVRERTFKNRIVSGQAVYLSQGVSGKPALQLNAGGVLQLENPIELSPSKDWSIVLVGGFPTNAGDVTYKIFSSSSPSSELRIKLHLKSYLRPQQQAYTSCYEVAATGRNGVNAAVEDLMDLPCLTARRDATYQPFIIYVVYRSDIQKIFFSQQDGTLVFNEEQVGCNFNDTLVIRQIGHASNSQALCVQELIVYNGIALTVHGGRSAECARLFDGYFNPVYEYRPRILSRLDFDWFKRLPGPSRLPTPGRLSGQWRKKPATQARDVTYLQFSKDTAPTDSVYQGVYLDRMEDYEEDTLIDSQYGGYRWTDAWRARGAATY